MKVPKKLNPLISSPVMVAQEVGREACSHLNESHRASLGQYFTPPRVATFLSSFFNYLPSEIKLLDAGGGVGSLTAAFVEQLINQKKLPRSLKIVVWEIEKKFHSGLEKVLAACTTLASNAGIATTTKIIKTDFLEGAIDILEPSSLFTEQDNFLFTHAILNPPYGKINASSRERLLLRRGGLETSNLYTGFMWLAARLLAREGEMVAITPRSFANGPYFLPFRKQFFSEMALKRVHTFECRNALFSGDQVLQENLILNARRSNKTPEKVLLSTSIGDSSKDIKKRLMSYNRVIDPQDKNLTLHLSLSEMDEQVSNKVRELPCTLTDLQLTVSTGRVVDFRARKFLRKDFEEGCVPLIYPLHLNGSGVRWPKENAKKANAIVSSSETRDLLVPNCNYVLVKRFTSKEEKRRIVATLYQPNDNLKKFQTIGFENHLNYFYKKGGQLDGDLAKGLAIFLNSSLVDGYFRQFSGHTQVNATDLRGLRYPTERQLRLLSSKAKNNELDQTAIDSYMTATL